MKIASRNVNGIRAVLNKGFFEWVKENDRDIFCLQEVKAFETQIPPELRFHLSDYHYLWHKGTRPGYAGTAIFYKKNIEIKEAKSEFPIFEFWEEGRTTEIIFLYKGKEIVLMNIYFPNGGERADGTEMLTYKLDYYKNFIKYCNEQKITGREIITTGDFNICHQAIDIARPEENKNSIGFLPIERAEMDTMLAQGYTDVRRWKNPTLAERYTWWSYRAGSRPRNVGWRLDYFWVSGGILPLVKDIQHQDDVLGSDHCPIFLELS